MNFFMKFAVCLTAELFMHRSPFMKICSGCAYCPSGLKSVNCLKAGSNPATRFLLRATDCIFAMKSVYHMIRMNFADIFPEILYPFRSICAVLLRFLLTAVHSVSARLLTACLRIIFPKDLRLPHFVDAADGAFGNRLFSVRFFVPCDYALTTN